MDAIDIRKGGRLLLDPGGILAGEWALKRLMDLPGEHDIENDAIRERTLDVLSELRRMQPRDGEMTQ